MDRSVSSRDEAALGTGRLLARQVAGAIGSSAVATAQPRAALLAEALRAISWPLASAGCRLEILRTSETGVVLRSRPTHSEDPSGPSCEVARGLLEALPQTVAGLDWAVVETRCDARTGGSCLFTVFWGLPGSPEGPAIEVRATQVYELSQRDGEADRLEVHPIAVHELTQSSVPPLGDEDSGPGDGTVVTPAASEAVLGLSTVASPAELPAPPTGREGVSPLGAHRLVVGRLRASRLPQAPPWVARRAWLVAGMVVLGLLGGMIVGSGRAVSYSARAICVVRSGTATSGPGQAQEASALAVTYAALIPSDTALLDSMARRLSLDSNEVGSAISVTAETGTALVELTYTAPTSSQAVRGARTAARLVSSSHPPGSAIVPGSVALVTSPSSATRKGSLGTVGLAGGAAAGLLVGIVLLLTLERVDARIDDPDDLSQSCACPATRVPGGISVRELAVVLARAAPDRAVTVVPISKEVSGAAKRLGYLLASWWTGAESLAAVPVVAPYGDAPWQLSDGDGPTLLVVGAGERARVVRAACERLEMVGRSPVFGILVGARRRIESGDL